MADHLRYSGLGFEAQRAALIEIIRSEPVLMDVLQGLRAAELPDWLLVAGALYNVVWNRLTSRPSLTGVKDIDVFYFDATDPSYEAEDRVIKRLSALFSHLPVPVEARNQARVHLWFPQKFSQPFAPLTSSGEMLGRYASKTHAVAARLEPDDALTIVAPFGLDHIFSFNIVPNRVLENNAPAHATKAARAQSIWPEITIEPW